MERVSVAEFRAKLGELVDKAGREPVGIDRYGRETAVLMSQNEYERMRRAEERELARVDAFLDEVAANAGKGEYRDAEEVFADLKARRYHFERDEDSWALPPKGSGIPIFDPETLDESTD